MSSVISNTEQTYGNIESTVEPLHNGHLGDRGVAVVERWPSTEQSGSVRDTDTSQLTTLLLVVSAKGFLLKRLQ